MFICKNELFFNFEIILELSSLIKQVSEVLHEHLLVLSPFVSCQNVYKADLTNDWTILNQMKVHFSIFAQYSEQYHFQPTSDSSLRVTEEESKD